MSAVRDFFELAEGRSAEQAPAARSCSCSESRWRARWRTPCLAAAPRRVRWPSRLPPAPRRSRAVAVSQAPANPNQPISETTNGTSKQHGGSARNPFDSAARFEQSVIFEHQVERGVRGLELLHHEFFRVSNVPVERRGNDSRDAQGNDAGETQEGLRPLPRDRAARRRAGGGRRSAAPAGPAEDLQGHDPRRTAARQGQSTAHLPGRGAAHRQGRAVRAHRRGDPARERHAASRARRSARRSSCRSDSRRRSKSSNRTAPPSPTN